MFSFTPRESSGTWCLWLRHDEATDETWRAGYTPVGRPVFVGLTNGEPISYRFDVPVDTSAR